MLILVIWMIMRQGDLGANDRTMSNNQRTMSTNQNGINDNIDAKFEDLGYQIKVIQETQEELLDK